MADVHRVRPFVDRGTINLEGDKRFAAIAEGLSDANRYVVTVRPNGRPLTGSYVIDAGIRAGADLRVAMATVPNRTGDGARGVAIFRVAGRDHRPTAVTFQPVSPLAARWNLWFRQKGSVTGDG